MSRMTVDEALRVLREDSRIATVSRIGTRGQETADKLAGVSEQAAQTIEREIAKLDRVILAVAAAWGEASRDAAAAKTEDTER